MTDSLKACRDNVQAPNLSCQIILKDILRKTKQKAIQPRQAGRGVVGARRNDMLFNQVRPRSSADRVNRPGCMPLCLFGGQMRQTGVIITTQSQIRSNHK